MNNHDRAVETELENRLDTPLRLGARLRGVHQVHGPQVVEEVGHPEDEIVLEDVMSLVEDILPAPAEDVEAAGAGEDGEGGGGDLVGDVVDAGDADVVALAEGFTKTRAGQEQGQTVEHGGEKQNTQAELHNADQQPGFVLEGVEHHDVSNKGEELEEEAVEHGELINKDMNQRKRGLNMMR